MHINKNFFRAKMEDKLFKAATEHVRRLKNLSESSMLHLYGFYKQATVGPCTTPKPGFWDMVGKSKWESWKKLESMDIETAKEHYINLVQHLDPGWEADEEMFVGEVKPQGMGVSVSTMSYEQDQYISNEDKTILDWCKEDNISEVEQILSSGICEVDSKDENGMTMLHWSSDRGHCDMIKMLINHGANTNVQDGELQTPLHYAVVCEHDQIIRILLENGANPNLQDETGATPLDVASSASVRELLKNPVNAH